MLISGGLYLVLSVLVWWNVWSSHPTSTTTCGCGDSSLFTWFLEWPAYAMTHGLNPLFSTAMIYPRGVNLLANTAEVGFGVVLAPITWIFGPVATLNVALTLSPALSALAMFVLLRRWVTWQPAAFFGGLLYGFSPFFLSYLTDAHLMIGAAFVPPLIVACLDELMVRQRRRPIATGVVLGLLVVVQFFIGTEVLAIVIVAVVIATALLVIYAGLRHFDVLRTHVRPAVVGLCSAGVTAGVLLAYPIWFAFAGPAHLSGNLWDNPFLSYGGPNVSAYFVPEAPSGAALATSLRWGGYQGLTLSQQYFGFGMAAVLVLGCIVWRKDRRLWLFGAVGLSGVLLAFGLGIKGWSAWRLFVRFPTMENIIPGRFLLVVYLAVATMLAIILDHAYGGVRDWWQATSSAGPHDVPGIAGGGARRVAAAVGVLLAVIALGPIAAYLTAGPAHHHHSRGPSSLVPDRRSHPHRRSCDPGLSCSLQTGRDHVDLAGGQRDALLHRGWRRAELHTAAGRQGEGRSTPHWRLLDLLEPLEPGLEAGRRGQVCPGRVGGDHDRHSRSDPSSAV